MRTKPIQLLILYSAIACAAALALPMPWSLPPSSPGIYYVNVGTGNDANPGTISQPWATVKHGLTNGGVIGLYVQGNDVETNLTQTNAIWIAAYGAGFTNTQPSTYTNNVLTVVLSSSFLGNCQYTNLSFIGPNIQPTTNDFSGIWVTNSTGLMATNFVFNGISVQNLFRGTIIGTSGISAATYSNILFINSFGSNQLASVFSATANPGLSTSLTAFINVVISNCVGVQILSRTNTTGSTGGTPFYLSFCGSGFGTIPTPSGVYYCIASNIGSQAADGTSGPAGIQLNACSNAIVEHCVVRKVYASVTNGVYLDGQGIGIAYSSGSFVAFCDVADCQGAGISPDNSRNNDTVCFNVLKNNGIYNQGDIWIETPGATGGATSNLNVFNNTIVGGNSSQPCIGCTTGGPYFRSCSVFNNAILGYRGQNMINFPANATTNLTLNYNNYYASGGSANFVYGGTSYSSFAAYQTGSSQDANSQHADPGLYFPFQDGPSITNPVVEMATWTNFMPQTNGVSILVSNGGNLTTLLGINLTNDFQGNPVGGQPYTNIGAFQLQAQPYTFAGYNPSNTVPSNLWLFVHTDTTNREPGSYITNLAETWKGYALTNQNSSGNIGPFVDTGNSFNANLDLPCMQMGGNGIQGGAFLGFAAPTTGVGLGTKSITNVLIGSVSTVLKGAYGGGTQPLELFATIGTSVSTARLSTGFDYTSGATFGTDIGARRLDADSRASLDSSLTNAFNVVYVKWSLVDYQDGTATNWVNGYVIANSQSYTSTGATSATASEYVGLGGYNSLAGYGDFYAVAAWTNLSLAAVTNAVHSVSTNWYSQFNIKGI